MIKSLKKEDEVFKIGLSELNTENLKNEYEALKKKFEELNNILSRFVEGRENLGMLLSNQRSVYDKIILEYDLFKKQKFLRNFFVRSTNLSNPFITSSYCGRKGHISYFCSIKRNSYVSVTQIWVRNELLLLTYMYTIEFRYQSQ